MVRGTDDCDMVFTGIQLFQKRHTSPSCAQYYQLWLVLLVVLFGAVVVVDQVFGDGKILWSAASRV